MSLCMSNYSVGPGTMAAQAAQAAVAPKGNKGNIMYSAVNGAPLGVWKGAVTK